MEWYVKMLIGGLGGLAACMSKILALDAATLAALLRADRVTEAENIRATILIHSPIMIALGMIVASMVDETIPIKLFAIGVSAPALIAPWLSSGPVKVLSASQTKSVRPMSPLDGAKAGEPAQPVSRMVGLKFLFGIGS